ncbi:DUF397 domain-containing protein [Plantactinospora sp. ZYX-F-223]|uniref:DUF397 domain-containing protein n=1 Tax=Plantactinospora sp. ZYX-F-223 TaxID=3144103 RepID=UPI0031FC0110
MGTSSTESGQRQRDPHRQYRQNRRQPDGDAGVRATRHHGPKLRADGGSWAAPDSKDRQGPALAFGPIAWRAFLDGVARRR